MAVMPIGSDAKIRIKIQLRKIPSRDFLTGFELKLRYIYERRWRVMAVR